LAHRTGTVRSCGTVLPLGFPSLGFEGLGFPFPYSPLSFALVGGASDCGDLGPWLASLGCGDFLAGLRGLASLGKRAENFFEEKSCTRRKSRFYVYQVTGIPGSEPQKNTMTTQDLQNAEASAFAAKQSAFRAYFAAAGTEAEQAASEAYAAAFRAYVAALDAWTASVKGGAL